MAAARVSASTGRTPVERLARLLDAVVLAGGRLRFRDAVRHLAPAPPSTVDRLLRAATAAGLLARSRDGYLLTGRVARWAAAVPAAADLRLHARPHLERLASRHRATAALVAHWDGHLTILDRIAAPDLPSLLPRRRFMPTGPLWLGGPLWCEPALFEDTAAFAAASGLDAGRAEALRRRCRRGLATGLVDDGALVFAGLHRLAAPVRVAGAVAAALAVVLAPGRPAAALARARRDLRAAARLLADAIAATG